VPWWHVLYQPYLRNTEVELPGVDKGDTVTVKKLDFLAKETQPPKRYTPSSIIKELEKRNLGTKATRADIVDTLFNRGYVEGTKIQATQFGIQVVDTLDKHSPKILDEELTKTFEEHMEHIREGKEKPERVLADAKTVLTVILKDFKAHEKDIGAELLNAVREARDVARTIATCPVCKKGTLKINLNKATRQQFLGCDQYPACATTYPLPQNALVKPDEKACEACGFARVLVIRKRARPQQLCINPACPTKKLEKAEEKKVQDIESGKLEKKCPKCGQLLVVRRSFYGQFLGCSSYPKCRHTEKLDGEKKAAAVQKKTI
jgi:DNA topoisomerase-1